MEDYKEVEINSTKLQIEEFMKSILWDDIKRELEAWKRGFEDERGAIVDDAATEHTSTANVLLHFGDINGRIKAVNYLLSLPDVFLQILEGKKDDTRSKQTRRSSTSK